MTGIVKALYDLEGYLARDSTHMTFIYSTKEDTIVDVFIYNELLDHINNFEEDKLVEWKLKATTSHEGPLVRHPNYNGSTSEYSGKMGRLLMSPSTQ